MHFLLLCIRWKNKATVALTTIETIAKLVPALGFALGRRDEIARTQFLAADANGSLARSFKLANRTFRANDRNCLVADANGSVAHSFKPANDSLYIDRTKSRTWVVGATTRRPDH